MWVLGVLPGLVLLALVGGGIALIVRGRGPEGWNIQFPGVLLGYCAIAMLAGVFMVGTGGGLLLKAGLAESAGRDFSYNDERYEYYSGTRGTVDPSDNEIRDDIANGISLTFAGTVLFALHAFGAAVLRRREAPGQRLVARAYSLIGLGTATLAFLAAGATALNDIVRRYVVGGDTVEPWQMRHPGEPLAIAIAMMPLVAWFGLRVWQELAGPQEPTATAEATVAPLQPNPA